MSWPAILEFLIANGQLVHELGPASSSETLTHEDLKPITIFA